MRCRWRILMSVLMLGLFPALLQPAAARWIMRCSDASICTPEMFAQRVPQTPPPAHACCKSKQHTPYHVEIAEPELPRLSNRTCRWAPAPERDLAPPAAKVAVASLQLLTIAC